MAVARMHHLRPEWRGRCIMGRSVMPELIVPALALVGLVIATALYLLLVRRRGHVRHVRRADDWDREISQARAVQRLEHMEKEDRNR